MTDCQPTFWFREASGVGATGKSPFAPPAVRLEGDMPVAPTPWAFVPTTRGPKDFEDRGDQFRRLVQALPGFVPYGAKVG